MKGREGGITRPSRCCYRLLYSPSLVLTTPGRSLAAIWGRGLIWDDVGMASPKNRYMKHGSLSFDTNLCHLLQRRECGLVRILAEFPFLDAGLINRSVHFVDVPCYNFIDACTTLSSDDLKEGNALNL